MDHATGARLRDAREQRGLTPDEVASAIGIPPEAVTDIEQGDALRHYGPGLAAAWTWAVGRHLGVAIDHELATWQPPPSDEPAIGHDPGHPPDPTAAAARSDEGTGAAEDGAPAEPSGAEGTDGAADDAGDAAFREPTIAPGWLADYDHDPLESFDPSSTDRGELPRSDDGVWLGERREAGPGSPDDRGEPGGGEALDQDGDERLDQAFASLDPSETGEGGGPAEPRPADPWAEPDAWAEPDDGAPAEPDDDLWGPDAGASPAGDDPFATTNLGLAAPTSPDAPTLPWESDEAASPDPTESLTVPDPTGPLAGSPAPGDTGELPADADTRVLAYTEGDEAAPLEAPSRARTVGAALAALVVLVGAGIGVGALAAQLLDAPDEDSAASDGQDVDLAGDADEDTEPDDGADVGDADDPEESDDESGGIGQSGGDSESEIDGDASAAAAPSETTVQVLDGAGDDGRYAEAQDVLEELGHPVIASGPAASEYDETTVFVTDGFADEAAALAESDDRFENQQPNDVGLSEDVELHVIVGGDWPDPDDD